MSLEEQITEDMKRALKSGNKKALETIRTLRAQIKDARISKGSDLNDDDVVQLLTVAAKRRREAIKLYEQGKRDDLVASESEELELINRYLPEQLSEKEIEDLVRETISQTGAQSEKDTGRVMGAIMPKVKGKADGKMVQQKVRDLLSQNGQ